MTQIMRSSGLLAVVLYLIIGGGFVGLTTPQVAAMTPMIGSDDQTQDIVYMRDGRELTGRILEERQQSIVFLFIDRNLNIETTLTLARYDILDIERNVPIETGIVEPGTPKQRPQQREQERRPRGLAEGDPNDTSLPSIYVIPMKGQVGTDIHPEIYTRIIEDIRKQRPDVIVWHLRCSDHDELMYSFEPRQEQGILWMIEDYQQLVRLLQDQLPEFRQVMWVEDSVGVSSLIALAWEEMYMMPGARLGGLRGVADLGRFGDSEVQAKLIAAWVAMGNSFLIRGNRPLELGEAMMRPHHQLSATWRGRDVHWRLDTSGEYIVNSSTQRVAEFRARDAENFGISNGTAETVDDLAFLLGFREYRLITGQAQETIERYVEDWRRMLANAEQWWRDHHRHLGWAQGNETLRWLGRARSDLGRVINALRRYRAVELRFRLEHGYDLFSLEILDEQLAERIRGLRGGGGGGAGGGGGLGGGGRGG